MNILLFAVLLSIVQATPPIPRQTPDASRQGRNNIKKDATNKQKPVSASPTTQVPIETNPEKEAGQPIETENKTESISVSKLPPVSVSRDWIDYVALGFTGALVLVGIGGICAAIKTLRYIGNQTKAMIESQKPQIAAIAHGNPANTLFDRKTPRVEIEIHNRGQSAAHDLIYESWIELLPMPFVDFTTAADHHRQSEKTVLYPNHRPIIINLPIRRGVSEGEFAAIRDLRLITCIRIRVEYRDAFNPARYAEFGFMVHQDGMGFLPKYNDAN
jgi:hypothetical protein